MPPGDVTPFVRQRESDRSPSNLVVDIAKYTYSNKDSKTGSELLPIKIKSRYYMTHEEMLGGLQLCNVLL